MSKITLILGGARSGKSSYAQSLAEGSGKTVTFLATAQALDEEMSARIQKHRSERSANWETLEIPFDIASHLHQIKSDVVILDCITLLVSNLLMKFVKDDLVDEEPFTMEVQREVDQLIAKLRTQKKDWIIVSNELGLGLVPPYQMGRVYRDGLGWANQRLAREADKVIFMVAGIPTVIKQDENRMLKIQNLSVNYGARRILHEVSLKVQSGEVLALIGPNGAGKSTLIRAVSGVIPSTGGSVRTNEHDFASLSPIQRARYVATVPQAVSLPPAYTVWETVLFGRTPYLGFLGQPSQKDEDIARQALGRVSALPFVDRRVGELSGGEQQRVLLARALCQSTPILLLDEPTAHLDLQYQVSLLELVHELAHKDDLAVLVALHDLNLAAHYADRIALMVAGNIKAIGKPEDVLKQELIEEAYCIPVHVVKHPFLDIPLVLPESGK